MRRFIWLGSIVLLGSSQAAWSQEAGSRVRITELETAGFARHTGTVVAAGPDTIILQLDRSRRTVAFPLAGLSQFEVSRGRNGQALLGAGLGLLAGAGAGALLAVQTCGACSGEDNDKALAALLGAGLGGGIGLVVGAVVGATSKTDRWEAVPSSRVRVSAGPTGSGGFRLGLAVQF